MKKIFSAKFDFKTLVPTRTGTFATVVTRTCVATLATAALSASIAQAEPRVTDVHPEESLVWIERGFTNPDIKTFRVTSITDLAHEEPGKFTHTLSPSLVMFRNSGWSEQQVGRRMERAAVIYAQCRIKMESFKLYVVNPPFGHRSVVIDRPYEGLDVKIAESIPQIPKPILYFVKKALNGYTGWATPRFHTPPGPFQDGAWLTSTILAPGYGVPFRNKSYSVEAHELAHIIGNRNHVADEIRNILGGTMGTGTDEITAEQCEAFRNHDLVEEIVQEITVTGSRPAVENNAQQPEEEITVTGKKPLR